MLTPLASVPCTDASAPMNKTYYLTKNRKSSKKSTQRRQSSILEELKTSGGSAIESYSPQFVSL